MSEHERIAAIRERLAKATPGQWWLCDGDQSDPLIVAAPEGVTDLRGAKVVLGYSLYDGNAEAHYIVDENDARLMAGAKSDLAFLLSLVDRLAKENAKRPTADDIQYVIDRHTGGSITEAVMGPMVGELAEDFGASLPLEKKPNA